MASSTRQNGFTLLELLVVMAIIGIVAGLGFSNYIRNIRTAEVQEAASILTSQIRQARSEAQKKSTDMTVSWNGSGQYAVNVAGATASYVSLPNQVTLKCTTNCLAKEVTFTAPFGELNSAAGTVFEVNSPYSDIPAYEIRLVGVTGKVMMVRKP